MSWGATYIGVQPKEKTTIKRNIKDIPAFERPDPIFGLLKSAEMMARRITSVPDPVNTRRRRPK